MENLTSGLSFLDLKFQQRAGAIATAVLHDAGGVALVDPGPASTLATLRSELAAAGIALREVTALLLTHIHLDHAGAAGVLVRENPKMRVYVHEKGAPHLIDPSKLLGSASRLYGDQMDQLWGEVAPVPADVIATLSGGERLDVAGRRLDVVYTPGHASHHVSYWCPDAGVAFVGDTAGMKLGSRGVVLPPTPPPDIDLELWNDSVAAIDRWRPETLFVTHFGPRSPAGLHLVEFRERLEAFGALARASLSRQESDEAREAWFAAEVRRDLARRLAPDEITAYEVVGRFDLSWRGLARYWRKRLSPHEVATDRGRGRDGL